jgi:ABC-2 type transport system ATP-binding protein
VRRRTVVVVGAAALVAVVGGSAVAVARSSGYGVRTTVLSLPGVPESGQRVGLDATLYTPVGAGRAPAVLLAHGYGGSKKDVDEEARLLAGQGYVALAWSARGFGDSGGLIHLDAKDFEVADARSLIDYLATRPEVLLDGPGDPRVGVAGGSYGGALSLLLAGTDPRVDAIAPQITWNDLRQAIFPQSLVTTGGPGLPAGFTSSGGPGVFKRSWAGAFFGPRAGPNPSCGRLSAQLCDAYHQAAQTGRPTAAMLDLLAASNPSQVLDRIKAPTLLIQGEADSLFPLREGDANAAGIAANGTPVKVVWSGGGHDGGIDETERLRQLTADWFDRYLRKDGTAADQRFEITVPGAAFSTENTNAAPQVRVSHTEPGVTGTGSVPVQQLPLRGAPQTIVSPAGGSPSAVSSLPGLGSALTAAASAVGGAGLSVLPGQTASFDTEPLSTAVQQVGSPTVTLRVTSTATDATLFLAVQDVGPDGRASLPQGLVSPVYLADLPVDGQTITVRLPAVVHDVAVGHRLRVTVASTDQAFEVPKDLRQYRVALAGSSALTVPVVATTVLDAGGLAGLLPWALGLSAAVVALAGYAFWSRRRTGRRRPDPELLDVPLAIADLGKAYGDGYRAVSDLSFRVERGWVLGLLGPNGAGKTTTLRMLMGLIRPTEGEIRVFGHRITPGAPVLSRVGSFIEGPGFLPHVSGLDNLRLFWQATGRPLGEARLEDALEVAGLAEDVHRKVRTFSHGMRQRLAIAQAMLGLPDLLVLDEPTNGLDPPQIREMREVLARYAATGRTVVVSSHLLAEVEQTCTHVVVMHRGRLVAQGPVAELVGSATSLVIDVDKPERAVEVASAVDGVEATSTGIALSLVGTPRGELVRTLVDAGLQVDRVAPRRGLEEAFLALVGES